jgi:hypothetical protein
MALVALDRKLALAVDIPQVRHGTGDTRCAAGDLNHDFRRTSDRASQLGDLPLRQDDWAVLGSSPLETAQIE